MKNSEEPPATVDASVEPEETSERSTAAASSAALFFGLSMTTKGVAVAAAALLFLALLISASWSGDSYISIRDHITGRDDGKPGGKAAPPHRQPLIPITFSCPPNASIVPTCRRGLHPATAPAPSATAEPAASSGRHCPEYFRYIHDDLAPWRATGLTQEAVESARPLSAFRAVVLSGRLYIDKYHSVFQTRDAFTIWGLVQLLNRYPGRVPDVDLMFNLEDMPVVRAADYPSSLPPPPLFRYCKDGSTADILFPDWSFWGWPELNVKPWGPLMKDLTAANEARRWEEREAYAFWKGNPDVSGIRQEIMRCNSSHWNLHFFRQDWGKAVANGFKGSNLASQCTYRYKMYIDGRSWSVSRKYIFGCDSPVLAVVSPYQDFFSRGLIAGEHYWPIPRGGDKCPAVKLAVDWGNSHPRQAESMGQRGSAFMRDKLRMDDVYDYMLHLLTEYAKLLKYTPTRPAAAAEACAETVACGRGGLERAYMMASRERHVAAEEPCTLPGPLSAEERDAIARKDKAFRDRVERLLH